MSSTVIGSTLAQVILWHSHESTFTANAQAIIVYYEFENFNYKNTATPSRGQWVKYVDLSMFRVYHAAL